MLFFLLTLKLTDHCTSTLVQKIDVLFFYASTAKMCLVLYFAVTVNMSQLVTIFLMVLWLLGHSTSGQQYPNCGNCQRDGEYDMFFIIIT